MSTMFALAVDGRDPDHSDARDLAVRTAHAAASIIRDAAPQTPASEGRGAR